MKRLWNSSFAAKIFLSYFVILCLLFGGFYLFANARIRQFHISTISARMEQEAQLLGRILPWDRQGAALDELCRDLARQLGSRITLIAPDGTVLGDSAAASSTMENHGQRPEIVDALRSGSGSAIHYSTTVRHDLLYRAFRQSSDGRSRVVRIATPLQELESVIGAMRRSLLGGLLVASATGLLLAWAFSRYLSARVRRLVHFSGQAASGRFSEHFFPHPGRDEIAILERHLNEMSRKIRSDIEHITGEKEKTDSILRCMIEGVLVLDPRGNLVMINEQAKKLLSVPAGRDVHGVSILEVTRHPDFHTILEEILKFDLASDSFNKEIEIAPGHWFSVNAAPLRTTLWMTLGSILVFHDVSEIKRLEQIRADFVANVSHELRTPLTAIRGYVETLLHAPPSDAADHRQFLEIIDRHSERLTRLTEDLLVLSDLESGKVQMALQPTDAAQTIHRVLEIFWEQAHKKKIRLLQAIDAALPPLAADPDRLQQLLINLIDNAVKYTPADGQVTVAAKRADEGHLELSVSDTGPGIPEKDLPRLTERFYRVDKARSRELGGTGLGLAIVKHIVQAHHGTLTFESFVNQGTTVRVRLPSAAAPI